MFGIPLTWNTYLIILLCISYLWQEKCYLTKKPQNLNGSIGWFMALLIWIGIDEATTSRHVRSLARQRVRLGKLGGFGSMPYVSSTSGSLGMFAWWGQKSKRGNNMQVPFQASASVKFVLVQLVKVTHTNAARVRVRGASKMAEQEVFIPEKSLIWVTNKINLLLLSTV